MDGRVAAPERAQGSRGHARLLRAGPRIRDHRESVRRSTTSPVRLDRHAAGRNRLASHRVSARAFWIVALGAALAVLVGLNLFRAQEQAGVGTDAASPPFRAGVEASAAQAPATAVRGSPSVDQRVDTTGADG